MTDGWPTAVLLCRLILGYDTPGISYEYERFIGQDVLVFLVSSGDCGHGQGFRKFMNPSLVDTFGASERLLEESTCN